MTHSKEEMAKVWIDDEMTGKFPTNWREQVELGQEAFLAGFDAAESRHKDALEIFDNRRKLAHSLRAESPQVAAFVEAIGVEIDKALAGKLRDIAIKFHEEEKE